MFYLYRYAQLLQLILLSSIGLPLVFILLNLGICWLLIVTGENRIFHPLPPPIWAKHFGRKLLVFPRIHHFMWRACYGILATSNTIARRLRSDPSCPPCGFSSNSISHALLLCSLLNKFGSCYLGLILGVLCLLLFSGHCVVHHGT